MCGATRWRNLRQRVVSGLSPRVRGNLLKFGFVSGRHRSIPACAGQPKTLKGWRYQLAVYPRVCGATLITEFQEAWMRGLSPRVRGNRSRWKWWKRHRGSIPACAGQPTKMMSIVGIGMVYPRVCGATLAHGIPGRVGRGLSPRVRGNLPSAGGVDANRRSIPACAGQPWLMGFPAEWDEVYPRVCGATYHPPAGLTPIGGLSPRVRGNRLGLALSQASDGSIPACAGQPRSFTMIRIMHWVYPRVCGATSLTVRVRVII